MYIFFLHCAEFWLFIFNVPDMLPVFYFQTILRI